MKDVIITLLIIATLLTIAVITATVMMSTPDRICTEWQVIPKNPIF